jgi:regulator of protease activity HflC (stomatin/prohibitin superfamily)
MMRSIRYISRRIFAFPGQVIENILIGGQYWGYARLILVILGTWMWASLSKALLELNQGAQPPVPLLMNLRHWIIPVSVIIGAILTGAHYIAEIYEVPFSLAIRHLLGALFYIGLPRLTIVNGKRDLGPEEISILDIIGGPGIITVRQGSAVLVERLKEPSQVLGAGPHFISRFERIREIVSLADQHGEIDSKAVTTKDGIEVVIRAVQYRYRVKTGHLPGDYAKRTLSNPFPFSRQAVRRLAYDRTVGSAGLTPWAAMVRNAVDAAISDYVAAHTFDELMFPRNIQLPIPWELVVPKDPNAPWEAIRRAVWKREVRNRLRNVGAELLWVDIGHFEPREPSIDAQRVDTWQASWAGKAEVNRAVGEAQHLVIQEIERAKAQAEILESISQALQAVLSAGTPVSKPPTPVTLEDLFIYRLAEVLEALSDHPDRRPHGKTQLPG